MLMSIACWVVLGLVAGFVGNKVVNGRGDGVVLDIVLGIVGALVGGWIFNAIGSTGMTGFNVWSFFVAIVGSVVLLIHRSRPWRTRLSRMSIAVMASRFFGTMWKLLKRNSGGGPTSAPAYWCWRRCLGLGSSPAGLSFDEPGAPWSFAATGEIPARWMTRGDWRQDVYCDGAIWNQ